MNGISFFLIGLAVSVAVLGGAEYVHAQTVSVDRQTYTAGQTVTVRGSGLDSGIATIQIFDSTSTLKHIEIEGIGSDGSISAQIKTDETTWQAGTHTVRVFVGSEGPYETTFELIRANIPSPAPEPAPVDPTRTVSGFPDPNRGSQYYLDRYANEPAYREWFHSQFPNFTIYEVLGILPPAPDVQTNTRPVIAPVSNATVSSILEAYMSRGLVAFAGVFSSSEDVAATMPAGPGFGGFLLAGIIINGTDADGAGIADRDIADSDDIAVFIHEIGIVPPILSNIDDYTINARETLTFRVSTVDFGGDTITYRLSGAPTGATISGQGDFSWTPGSTDVSNHTFTIIAYDVHGAADAESVTITVLPAGTANQPPTVPDAAATVARDGLVTIIPAIHDPDGDRASIVDAGGDAGGMVTFRADRIEYSAATNAAVETITYTVKDSRGACSTGAITVDIQGSQMPGFADVPVQANAAPLLGAIPSMDIDVQDTLEFTAVACDRDGDALTYGLSDQPAGATMNNASGKFVWRPAASQAGPHTFTVTVTDIHGGIDSQTVTVRVITVPLVETTVSMPVGSGQGRDCADDDQCFIPYEVTVYVGGEVTWVNDDQQIHNVHIGEFGGSGPENFDSGLMGTRDSFSKTFEIAGTYNYDCSLHPWMTGVVTVLAENPPVATEPPPPSRPLNQNPVAPDLHVHTSQNIPVRIEPGHTDPDGDDITIVNATGATKGSIVEVFLLIGVIVYNPDLGEYGTDTITYTVLDSHGNTDTGSITVHINAQGNSRPALHTIGDKSARIDRSLTFTATATDLENDTLTYAIVDQPAGAVINSTTGVFSWTPSRTGSYTLTVVVYDSRGGSDTEDITITVRHFSRYVPIGLLLPFTGDVSSHGQENAEASRLAADDFNRYLAAQNVDWRMRLVEMNTASSPAVALKKIQSLHALGISVVVGPETSSSMRNVKGYSDANNMLLVSCCSTSPSLAIEGDSVYRLVPDDSFHGVALSQMIPLDGISVLVPVWRGDVWGDGLQEKTDELFVSENSRIFDKGVRYSPEAVDFSAEASLLAQKVQGYVDEHGADRVAVLYIGFGEVVQFMQAASRHDILDDVRWYGSDANVKERRIVNDRIASGFAQAVTFTAAEAEPSDNPTYDRVVQHVKNTLGRSPSTYVHSSYDAVWLVGLSIIETGGADAEQIKVVFSDVAANYTGAIGDVLLNDAGDLVPSGYEVWYINENNTWTKRDKIIDVREGFRPPGAGPLGGEHVHASVLVKIFGDTFDFSQSPYQLQSSWIRFEDQDGTTIHRHATGVTLEYLFDSMDIGLDDQCYIFRNERGFCTTGEYSLKFYINGQRASDIRDYVIADQDRILISYGDESEEEIQEQLQDLNSQIILG